ncbi:winged helix-turn-helix domain-containing protein [Exiguobacterium undae]|uniref:Uncharacterized protein n=1 Tax=Exiguobacterium undae TaxID=169177 RepID=A0ABX2VB80_9BACL|nr:helix-turn-helix domain-containing protein [Exiguobacterium undae]OAN15492.1 hypothetical protein A3783_06035 [Exiguobacterium undae]
MSSVNEITKLIFDDISYKIIEETADKTLTRKELSKKLDIPSSNLYYKINKLLNVDVLRIKDQKQIGNLIENGYSSNHLFTEEIVLNRTYLQDNFERFLHYYLLSQKKMINLLEQDLQQESFEDSVKIILGSVSLTKEKWEDFHKLIEDFLKENESTSPNSSTIDLTVTAIKEK